MQHRQEHSNLPHFSTLVLTLVLILLSQITFQDHEVQAATGKTIYAAPNGGFGNEGTQDKPATFQQAIDKANPGDTIVLRGGTYSGENQGRVDIDKKNGSPTSWYTITTYPGETAIMDGKSGTDIFGAQALNFDQSSYWRVEGVHIRNYTGGGIYLTRGTNHVTMSNLDISNLDYPQNTGIGVAGIMADNNTSYCTVINSNIYNIGLKLNKSKDHGIYIGYGADHWTFEANRIHDTAGAGIQMYGDPNGGSYSTVRSNLLYNNHAYGLAMASNATGNFVTDNIFYGNGISDVYLLENAAGNTFSNNRFGSSQASYNIAISDLASASNTFDSNEYFKSAGLVVSRDDQPLSFPAWQSLGQEAQGSFNQYPFPLPGGPSISGKSYTFQRLSGLTRFATARAIAEEFNHSMTSQVVVASGLNFPDALSGSVLAKQLDAPILLTGVTSSDNSEALAYIKKYLNSSGIVYLLGGPGAVSSNFEQTLLSMGYKTNRLAGADRYATNQAIINKLQVTTGTPVIIASANDFPDALSISGVAGTKGYPIILSAKDELSAQAETSLSQIKPTTVYIVGGTGVLSDQVKLRIQELTGLSNAQVIRLWGADRYQTSLNISAYFKQSGDTVALAYGENFPDALAGSVLAARLNAPILLLDRDTSSQKTFLDQSNYTQEIFFGGKGPISNTMVEELTR